MCLGSNHTSIAQNNAAGPSENGTVYPRHLPTGLSGSINVSPFITQVNRGCSTSSLTFSLDPSMPSRSCCAPVAVKVSSSPNSTRAPVLIFPSFQRQKNKGRKKIYIYRNKNNKIETKNRKIEQKKNPQECNNKAIQRAPKRQHR